METNSTPSAGEVYDGLIRVIENSGIDLPTLHQAMQLWEKTPTAVNGCFPFVAAQGRLALSKNVYDLIGGNQQTAGSTGARSGTPAGSSP